MLYRKSRLKAPVFSQQIKSKNSPVQMQRDYRHIHDLFTYSAFRAAEDMRDGPSLAPWSRVVSSFMCASRDAQ